MKKTLHYLYFQLDDWIDDWLSAGLNESKEGTPALTAQRFIKLFNLHNVETTEIPEIKEFSELTFSDLSSTDKLIKVLTPDLIDLAANYFGIRKEWLRSGEPNLYSFCNWYKGGWDDFFKDYYNRNRIAQAFPFYIIVREEKLDKNDAIYQPFILVLENNLTSIGDKDVCSYQISSKWHWGHEYCRLQAKALATVIYNKTLRSIPICIADNKTFHQVSNGYIPPPQHLKRSSVYFEDYAAVRIQNVDPYEVDEWDAIIAHVEKNRREMEELKELHKLYQYPQESTSDNEESKAKSYDSEAISQMNRNNSNVKYVPLNKHKEKFRAFVCEKSYENKSQAARDYFNALELKERKVVVPSYYEKDHDNCVRKSVRTLTNALRK